MLRHTTRHTLSALLLLPLALVPPRLEAQKISYQAGYSTSWGERNGITICDLQCYPGSSVRTAGDLTAPLAGVGVTFWQHRSFWLESGSTLTKKGWTISGPHHKQWYVEVPLLLHVGYMPSSTGVGLSIAGGGTLDVDFPDLWLSRPGAMASAQLHLRIRDQLWSGGVRWVQNLKRDRKVYLHAISYFVSFAP